MIHITCERRYTSHFTAAFGLNPGDRLSSSHHHLISRAIMLFAWTRPSSPTRAKLTPRCTWVSSMYAVEKCMYNLQQQPGLFLSFLSFLSFFSSPDVNFDMVPVSTMQCKRRMHVEDDQNHQNYQDYQRRMQTAIKATPMVVHREIGP